MRRRLSRALLVLGPGIALAAAAMHLAGSDPGFSLALRTRFGATTFLTAGGSLLLAAALLLGVRARVRAAVLVFLVAAFWFFAEFNNPAAGLGFSLGLVLFAACPAALAHLALAYPSGRLDQWSSVLVVLFGYLILIGVLGLAAALFFDPQASGCTDCSENLLLLANRAQAFERINQLGVLLGTVWCVVALAAVCWRLLRASRTRRRSTGAVTGACAGFLLLTVVQYGGSLQRGHLGITSRDATIWLAQAACLFVVAMAILADLQRARQVRRAMTRLLLDLDVAAPAGGLRVWIANQMSDPDLVIAYPVADARYADAQGHLVQVPSGASPGKTTLERAGVEIAVVLHQPHVMENQQTVDDVVSTLHLGLENERLHATALIQIADLRASGARILKAGDEQRRLLERDLHDGAQQQLIGLSLALRLASRNGPPELEAAHAALLQAIAQLRTFAGGMYPLILHDQGLAAALQSLIETRPLRLIAVPSVRLADVCEATAFLLVVRATANAPAALNSTLIGGVLYLDLDLDVAGGSPDIAEVNDRVTTLGGTITVSTTGETTRLHLELPNATNDPVPA